MNIFTTGNPLKRNNDKIPIYTSFTHMPVGTTFDLPVDLKKENIHDFILNLYYITIEKNGFSYFYPNSNENYTLCRFEWHYNFRGKKYFLRIGLTFEVKESTILNVKYYIEPHEYYEKEVYKGNKVTSFEITEEEKKEIDSFLEKIIKKAFFRISSTPKDTYNILKYIELTNPIKNVIDLTEGIKILPSRIIKNKIVSVAILPIKGFSYNDCLRFAEEKINLLCAFFTLVNNYAKVKSQEELPLIIEEEKLNKINFYDDLNKFYPNAEKNTDNISMLPEFSIKDKENLYWIYNSYKNINTSDKNKSIIINIVFSYYSAIKAMKNNRTLSLTCFVACLDSIATKCEPKYKIKHGIRKTIEYYLGKNLKNINITEMEDWIKRVYYKHRCDFVHGANIKFLEYTQNMDGKQFAGIPISIPINNKIITEQAEYKSDLEVLIGVTEICIYKYLEKISEIKYFNDAKFKNIKFKPEAKSECYAGMINSGWHRF